MVGHAVMKRFMDRFMPTMNVAIVEVNSCLKPKKMP